MVLLVWDVVSSFLVDQSTSVVLSLPVGSIKHGPHHVDALRCSDTRNQSVYSRAENISVEDMRTASKESQRRCSIS